MKNQFKIILFMTAIIWAGCEKSKLPQTNAPAQNNPNSGDPVNLSEYMSNRGVKAEKYAIQADQNHVFTSKNGSTVRIYANTFEDYQGNLVTGEIEITLKEVFTPKDMIFSGVFPISNGQPLNSGAQFFLGAKQDNQKLRIADGKSVVLDVPAQTEDNNNMMLFLAGDENEDELDEGGWQFPDSSSTNSSFYLKFGDKEYSIGLDSMGWCNIDAFLWPVEYFQITFNLIGVDGLEAGNTRGFAVFKEQNSVWPLLWMAEIKNNKIIENHLADVPMTILVFGTKGNDLYAGSIAITPEKGIDYDIEMKPVSKDDLDKIIDGL